MSAVAAALTLTVLGGASATVPDLKQREAAANSYVNAHADKEDMVMMPMRDGVKLYGLILFPKGRPRANLPTVLLRTPYLVDPDAVQYPLYVRSFLEHGYAVVFQYERGRYFSQGTYHYLGRTDTDGADTVRWITKQPWSNGKLGMFGCSAGAELQQKLNGAHVPGFAASVSMGAGAGIGRVGPYDEHGNFYRGGALIMGWFNWYYGYGYTYRPTFPENLTREQMMSLHRFWDLEPETVPDSGIGDAIWTLPINAIMSVMGATPSDMDQYVNRLANDPRWSSLGVENQGETDSAPMLMINSWYDISLGPNVAMFQYQAAHAATAEARDNMRMVIAPTTHCVEGSVESEHTVVGERDVGDARFDYVGLVQQWFDRWVKGVNNGASGSPKVQAYLMGANQWESYDAWPPRRAKPEIYYLTSDGRANSRLGNGRLSTRAPDEEGTDAFTYDPRTPVPSHGGGQQGWGISAVFSKAGSDDQSDIELRDDVLVYSTAPLTHSITVMGPVRVSLYLSSDRKDTDLTVKLVDVYPDGRAFNLDESIQRVRWRDGYDHPVLMQSSHVYRVEVGPLVTGNEFLPGHRIRIEVSSSNFPSFERNLNTGGNNYDEKTPLIAHNVIHHGPRHRSEIVLPVIGP